MRTNTIKHAEMTRFVRLRVTAVKRSGVEQIKSALP